MQEVIKSHCNLCGGLKNHEVLYKEEGTKDEELDETKTISWWESHELVRCRGCDSISLRHRSSFSEDIDDSGNRIIYTTYYPPSIFRKKPRWYGKVTTILIFGGVVFDLLNEVYICLQNGANRLAAMGVRSLIEHIMIEKIGDNGNFKENLKRFQKEQYISEMQKNVIESALDVGHAVTHRSFEPDNEILTSVVDIAENLIEMIYINPVRSKRILEKTPKRNIGVKND